MKKMQVLTIILCFLSAYFPSKLWANVQKSATAYNPNIFKVLVTKSKEKLQRSNQHIKYTEQQTTAVIPIVRVKNPEIISLPLTIPTTQLNVSPTQSPIKPLISHQSLPLLAVSNIPEVPIKNPQIIIEEIPIEIEDDF